MGKQALPVVVGVVLLAAGIVLAVGARSARPDVDGSVIVPAYGFEWEILPSATTERAFDAVLTVRDLQAGQVVSQPRVRSRWGERAEIVQRDEAAGSALVASVLVEESGKVARYRAELTRHGQVVAVHAASVTLAP